jgi:hypothetical protein
MWTVFGVARAEAGASRSAAVITMLASIAANAPHAMRYLVEAVLERQVYRRPATARAIAAPCHTKCTSTHPATYIQALIF